MLARVHAWLGIAPLAIYTIWHAWTLWPMSTGREAWLDRVLPGVSRGWVWAVVLLPLLAHAVIGWLRFWRAEGAGVADAQQRGLRWLQAATGAVLLIFLVFHLGQVWGTGSGPHRGVLDAYTALSSGLGRPLHLGLYLVGVSAVCFHLGHGLSRAVTTFGWVKSARALFTARLCAGALAFGLWVAFLQVLARLALGQTLIP